MAIIRSFGALQRIAAPTPTWSSASNGGGLDYSDTYATIYRTQPNVRTVVDFFSRNIAQLGLHVFRRLSDSDRERLSNHPLDTTIRKPSPHTTRYRLFEALMQDLGVYLNAFWLKIRTDRPEVGLARIPPEQMTVLGGLFPTGYKWTIANGQEREFPVEDIIHFGGYNPDNPLVGLSPIETLRQILAEDYASAVNRQAHWRNGARISGYIKRPKEAGRWSKDQREAFRSDWRQYQGASNAGGTPVLEDGMEFIQAAFSAKDSELSTIRKLTREECAAAYHVGILEHATFSNIKEQHKHLYADCLGPWLVMIEEQLELNLLPEFDDTDRVYLEFNIAEKLKGSFEEQMSALTTATGGKPIATQNEARARLNWPRSSEPGTDSLEPPANIAGNRVEEPEAGERQPDEAAVAAAVRANWQRQMARLSKEPESARAAFFAKTIERWDKELTEDLAPFYGEEASRIASKVNGETLALLNHGADPFARDISSVVTREE
jgi:HK97 family phage portal protein